MRNEIPTILESINNNTHNNKYSLVLHKILGRKAYGIRNNLFYDFSGRIVYAAGCNLIFSTFLENKELGESSIS